MEMRDMKFIPLPMQRKAEHFGVDLRKSWNAAPDLLLQEARDCFYCDHFDDCLDHLDNAKRNIGVCPNVDLMRILSSLR